MSKFIKLFSCMSVLTLAFAGVDAMNVNNANANNAGGLNGQNANAQQVIDDYLEFVHNRMYLDYCIRYELYCNGDLSDLSKDVDFEAVDGSIYRAAIDKIDNMNDYPNIQMMYQSAKASYQSLADEVLKRGYIAFLNSHNAEGITQLIKRYPDKEEYIQHKLAEIEEDYKGIAQAIAAHPNDDQ